MLIRSLLTSICFALAARPAFADSDALLGHYRDWEAHKLTSAKGETCYAVSRPKTKLPKKVNRDDTYFTVTNWPYRESKAEPSVVAGYPYKNGSTTQVTIKKAKFRLFTKNDGAWLAAPKDEQRLVATMKKGNTMVVRGLSQRGTRTTDTYSLAGFTRALDKIAASCK
jgi:Invasion associated locus B (IalB) protein